MKLYFKDFRRFVAKFNDNISIHCHTQLDIEILILLEGEYTVISDGVRYNLTPGDAFVAFPFVSHEYIRRGENRSFITIFPPSSIPMYSELINGFRPECPIVKLTDCTSGLHRLLERLCELGNSELGFGEQTLRSIYFAAIFGELVSKMKLIKLDDRHPLMLSQLLSYISSNYSSSELTLKGVADAICYSESYISHMLRRHMGMTFCELLMQIRLENAIGLLHGSMSITKIAENSGFSSLRSFDRAFYAAYGMTPSDYRKNHSKQ